MEHLSSHWTSFHQTWYLSIFRKSVENIQVSWKSWCEWLLLYMNTYIHLWQYVAELFWEWEMLQTSVVEKIIPHFLCLVVFFSPKSCRLWDNVEKYGTARQTKDFKIIWRMPVACWITKATDTHWEHVILIAFPQQKWVCERASMLRHTYIAHRVG
jgi:hypothetical protein